MEDLFNIEYFLHFLFWTVYLLYIIVYEIMVLWENILQLMN